MMKNSILFLISISFFLFTCSSKPSIEDRDISEDEMKPNLISVRTFLVDKQATAETAALFYNLKTVSKTRFLIGVHENPTTINTAAGVGEAIYGTDYMFITDYLLNQGSWYVNKQTEIRNAIKEQYKKGEVITMCWHYRNPIPGEQYDSSTGNFYWSSLIAGNPNQERVVPRLIPGGAYHDRLKASLDIVADFANTLVDDNGTKIPVIFRPWHEQSGDWFWWGVPHHCTQDEYIKLWRFTVEYLRDTKGIHHFLYAYSPNGNTANEDTYLGTYGYPGDEYVDIIGVDYYLRDANASTVAATSNQLKLSSDLAQKRVKVAALTETGYDASQYAVRPLIFTETFAPIIGDTQIAYMMIWSGTGSGVLNHYVPPLSYPNFRAWVRNENLTTPRVVTALNLPNMFAFPTL